MEGKRIEDIFKNAVKEHQVMPTSKVLNSIRLKLFLSDFFSLNPRKLNIGYVLVVLGGIIYFQTRGGEAQPEMVVNEADIQLEAEVVEALPVEETSAPVEISSPTIEDEVENIEKVVTAIYSMNTKSGCEPLTIKFRNESSNASEQLWDFGNGASSRAFSPKHTYRKPGIYTVTLETKAKNGTKAVQQQKVIVHKRPASDFEIDVTASDVDEKKVLFRNNSKNAVKYKWSFGDNYFSEERSPVHTYTDYKTYNVSMVAISEHGCADTSSYFNSFVAENYSLVFPKRFKPNLSAPNNGYYERPENEPFVFYPQNHGAKDYSLVIRTTTGSQVFKTNKLKQGWNGYINGRIAPVGQYQYTASGVYPNGQYFEFSGTFSIVIDNSYQDIYNH